MGKERGGEGGRRGLGSSIIEVKNLNCNFPGS